MILLVAFGNLLQNLPPLPTSPHNLVPCDPHMALPLHIVLFDGRPHHELIRPERRLDGPEHLALHPLVLLVVIFEEFVNRVLVLMSHSFETSNLKQALSCYFVHHIVNVVCVNIEFTKSWVLLAEPIPFKHCFFRHIILIRGLLNSILHRLFCIFPFLSDFFSLLASLLLY